MLEGERLIAFRVDGNDKICSGHVMRCLAIAKALNNKKQQCIFIIADGIMKEIIEKNGFDVICLDTQWDNMEDEISVLIPKLEKIKPKLIIVDSYYVTQKYMNDIKETIKLAYIDDINAFEYRCDLLINYSIYGNEMKYTGVEKEKQLIGCKYVPLRSEFQDVGKRKIKDEVKDILISTGGADIYGIGPRLVDSLIEIANRNNIVIHIVSGSLNSQREMLRRQSRKYNNLIVHENVTEMCKLMCKCDMAISASGSTLYELCATGMPTISYFFADNQIYNSMAFEKNNIIPTAGDWRENAEQVIYNIINFTEDMINNRHKRIALSEKMQTIVDGKGAQRLADYIVRYIE